MHVRNKATLPTSGRKIWRLFVVARPFVCPKGIRMIRITLLYVAALATVLVLADARMLPGFARHINDFPALDKVIHFSMFGLLALLVNLSLVCRARWPTFAAIAIGGMIVAALATGEELSNLLVDARQYSLGDLAANYLGVFCVGMLPVWFWCRRRRLAPLPVVRKSVDG